MRTSMDCSTKLFLYCFLLSILRTSTFTDTIRPGCSIRDGETIVSTNKIFELGFFSPGSSTRRYIGIWYKKVSAGTVVWVANRERPVIDLSGVLNITDSGVLVLLNSTKNVVWSSNVTRTPKSPVAQLMDSGNLVVRNENDSEPEDFLWQSFDYPADTILPGMKLGRNFNTGMDWTMSSWKSLDDPAKGEYSCGIDPRGFPQLVCKKGSEIEYRAGSWNGMSFSGASRKIPNSIYRREFVLNEKELYYRTEPLNKSVLSRTVVNASGITMCLTWIDQRHGWIKFYAIGEDQCSNFAKCGPNAKCKSDDVPVCSCLEGFEPKFARDWSFNEWSGGCVRKTPLVCGKGEGFVKLRNMRLPDTSNSWFNMNISLKECEELCLRNCFCTAYANSDIRNGGSGCLHWFNGLVDMREFTDSGQDIYIRMSASYIEQIKRRTRFAKSKKIGVVVLSFGIIIGLLMLVWFFYVRKQKLKIGGKKNIGEIDYTTKIGEQDLDLPIMNLTTVRDATNNFLSSNKLGQGGFGKVYKGILTDGQEVAVKRLSVNSGQGLQEFKNEVLLIAKLQHRNLVKLLGCCIEGDEMMLIYEYMPNKSLDYFIFDEMKSSLLDWLKRINIISGIARGLLYLHQDSRLRIIHRDLKAGNVLLDDGMTPKISDFGMARTFWGDQIGANTGRVVGTHGYMSPEYAVDGHFSTKSDVYSFGVLVLEIVSGKKNRGFSHPDHHHNLLGHAWILWNEGRASELINELLLESSVVSQIVRCIHVGLLCVQQRLEDRPTMSSVVLMLDSEIQLPQPNKPGFFTERSNPDFERESSSREKNLSPSYDVTLSELEPR